MLVKEVMTKNPAVCTRDANMQQAAKLMVDHDCGEIPVVDTTESSRLVGVITDRDIVCRAVARGMNPIGMRVGDCMSSPPFSCNLDTQLSECLRVMKECQIRRIPVTDDTGKVCGIVSQADVAKLEDKGAVAEVVTEVSRATQAMLA